MGVPIDDSRSDPAVAQADGRLSDVERAARAALEESPQDLKATMLLGVVTGKQGKYQESESLLRRAIALDPTSFHARMWLAIALRKQERAGEALAFAEEAANQSPGDANAHFQLGLCFLELRRFAEAEHALRKSVELQPSAAKIYEAFGRSLQGLDRYEEAVEAFRRASVLDTSNENILFQLGAVLMERFDGQGAAECARRILALNPHSRQGRLLLAGALFADQRGEEAMTVVTQLMEEAPDWELAALSAGRISQGIGKFKEAEVYFRRAVDIKPDMAQAYLGIVQGHRIVPGEEKLVERIKNLIVEPQLPPEELRWLHFALGKSYDDLGEYEMAMCHFDEANRIEYGLKFGERSFDREERANTACRLMDSFSSSFISKHRDIGVNDETPIFVVGMMRSGTTLTDQILSSHPEIGSAGEQQFWQANQNYAFNLGDGSLNTHKLRELATQYLGLLKGQAPSKKRVVDKMPGNYSVLGLIYLALPNARVVHISRNPVDTCISTYTTPNGSKVDWAHNKENVVFAYQEYLRFMGHWHEILPVGHILDIRYEELVRNPEQISKRLVEFCGLSWSDLCLRPEDNARTVTTPSGWQVRQPIHTKSLERWRNYEPWLGPFAELLGNQ